MDKRMSTIDVAALALLGVQGIAFEDGAEVELPSGITVTGARAQAVVDANVPPGAVERVREKVRGHFLVQ